ncbi:MAG: tRNA (adenosine(37)-N6)-threonylcarbamoyltransferase complex ATPase subunit type 1 TsaE [Chitinophagaceae bacterium]|nr:tRNA (adenosine(37)-N6)-threonylcarbamoyltransferase complex ATPase subunit type 1 TsaE [Chitinophagaceae bacterium]
MQIEYQLNEIERVVQQVWDAKKQYKIWTFNASMGVGKTTFINTLCKYLAIEELSNSPTFSIINEYFSTKAGTVFHLDLYRLKDEQEVLDVGIEDIINSNNYCFIEWPDKTTFLLPDEYCNIEIELLENGNRKITF